MQGSRIVSAVLVAVITVGGIGVALADNGAGELNEHHEIQAVLSAKTSLSQAIAAAERYTGGKAVETGLEHRDGRLAYQVKTAKGDTVTTVLVDPDSGKVLQAAAEAADRDAKGGSDAD